MRILNALTTRGDMKMSTENNGGQAFPLAIAQNDGMTMRDYFAASALQGLCANEQSSPFSFSCDPEEAANIAYKMADAMLARRNKQGRK